MVQLAKERTALIICDMQPDLIGSLKEKKALLRAIQISLEAARNNGWMVIFSGLKFKSGYEEVSPSHKLFGALSRLNNKLGDKAVHWFMEGWQGSDVVPELSPRPGERTVWRSRHIPNEVVDVLREEKINKAFIVGAKASGAVQISCQVVMDQSIDVSVIKECVQDDDPDRLQSTLEHLLPLYSSVVTLEEIINDLGGLDSFSKISRESFICLMGKGQGFEDETTKKFYASDCGRRGHGAHYVKLLLQRPEWYTYPTQTWYEDFIKGEFKCPLGKTIVDFCDEPEFSKVSMYLSGREYLDEKDKVIEIAGRFMPKTYCIEGGEWVDDVPPTDDIEGAIDAPWFIKVANKNLGGDAINIVQRPSEIMNFVDKKQRYVVQQHVVDPLLTDDGRKAHVKFYILLVCEDDGITWTLYSYKASLLSISPNPWSPNDLTQDTQVTIHRHHIPPEETEGWKQHWERTYEKCKEGTAEVIEKAIMSRKLKGRTKKQFEVFSVDWMPDQHGKIWMFEFNMSPAVWVRNEEFDGRSNDKDVRRGSLMKHDEIMLRDALSLVIEQDHGKNYGGLWECIKKFKGQEIK